MKFAFILTLMCVILGGCFHHKHHRDHGVKSKPKSHVYLNLQPATPPVEKEQAPVIPEQAPKQIEPDVKKSGEGSWMPWFS
jgi:hypothetical protein